MKTKYLSFVIVFLSCVPYAAADVGIGGGFTCSGDLIFKGTQEVTYTKAKSNIATTITKLKKKLSTAPTKKKKGIKAQISTLTQSKKLLTSCAAGTLDINQVDTVFTQVTTPSGKFVGTYSGSVGGFIPISGPIEIDFTLSGTLFGATLTIGGNVGNALNAQPLSFQPVDVGGIALPAEFHLADTFIGAVTLSISHEGHLSVKNDGTKGNIDLEANLVNNTIAGTLNGSYSGIGFTSNMSMSR